VFNQSINDLNEGERISLAQRAGAVAGGFVAAPLAESIGRALDVDLFEIQATDESGLLGPGVTLGQQVSDHLFVKFHQQFGSQDTSEFIIEYEIANFMRVRASGSPNGPATRANRVALRRVERAGRLIFSLVTRRLIGRRFDRRPYLASLKHAPPRSAGCGDHVCRKPFSVAAPESLRQRYRPPRKLRRQHGRALDAAAGIEDPDGVSVRDSARRGIGRMNVERDGPVPKFAEGRRDRLRARRRDERQRELRCRRIRLVAIQRVRTATPVGKRSALPSAVCGKTDTNWIGAPS
jgi:hypothetical protein